MTERPHNSTSRADAYRRQLAAMTAAEHFATDYRPVEPRLCLCDAEPGVFVVFTFAVLALHRPRRRPSPPTCSCGQPLAGCPVQSLAEGLLLTPVDPTPRQVW